MPPESPRTPGDPPLIDDRRETTSWVPAVAAIERVLPLIPSRNLLGIRKIVLLDRDYRRNGDGIPVGRYVPVQGTRSADIELYFETYEGIPEEAKVSPRFWLFSITQTLAHELYHHEIRFRRKHRPQFDREQAAADRWGGRMADELYHRLVDCQAYREEWDRIREAFDRPRRAAEPSDV